MSVIDKLNSTLAGSAVLLSRDDMEEIRKAFSERDALQQELGVAFKTLKLAEQKCSQYLAERDALRAELGQPVPLSEWQKLIAERNALRFEVSRLHSEVDRVRSQYGLGMIDGYNKGLAERDALRELLRKVASSGVEYEAPHYFIVQIDKPVWVEVTAALKERP